MYPYFLFAAIHHLKSSPTFSVRPRSSVGRVTVDLIRRSWVRFPPRSKDFFWLTPSGLFMGLSSTIIYTSELILCSTICVSSATRHNIHVRLACLKHFMIVRKLANASPGLKSIRIITFSSIQMFFSCFILRL